MGTRKRTRKQKYPKKMEQAFMAARTPYTVSRNIQFNVHRIMYGGMNNYKNFSNVNSNFTVNSVPNNNEPVTELSPPWTPRDSESINYNSSTKKYSFVKREEYQYSNKIWYMYIRIGSDWNPNCVVAILDSDSEFRVATIMELHYATTCSTCYTLPNKGVGARILMNTMLEYLREKGITEYTLSDNAMKTCSKHSGKYALSDLYFLANGETYYHKFGFFPSEYIEEYIQLVTFMKTVQWKTIQTLSDDKNYLAAVKKLEETLKELDTEDLAKTVFKTIWTEACETLKEYSQMIFIFIGNYLDLVNLKMDIPQLWKSFEQINNEELREAYNVNLDDTQKQLFFENVIQ